ncbi:MAG: hypothetical protein QW275_02955 [Candidatus Anstonellaceae archaeon]
MMRQKSKPQITPPVSKKIREFEKILNEDRIGAIPRKKPKGIKLEKKNSIIFAKLKKELRKPLVEIIDGDKYVRTCDWGNASAETLVRINLHELVMRAKEIGKRMLRESDQRLLEEVCLDPIEGMPRHGFLNSKGKQMRTDSRAVYEMIKQFFKDYDFIKRLERNIIREFRQESRKSGI